jgi:hypothetical protein
MLRGGWKALQESYKNIFKTGTGSLPTHAADLIDAKNRIALNDCLEEDGKRNADCSHDNYKRFLSIGSQQL